MGFFSDLTGWIHNPLGSQLEEDPILREIDKETGLNIRGNLSAFDGTNFEGPLYDTDAKSRFQNNPMRDLSSKDPVTKSLTDSLGMDEGTTLDPLTDLIYYTKKNLEDTYQDPGDPEPLPDEMDIEGSLDKRRKYYSRKKGRSSTYVTGGLFDNPSLNRPTLTPL